MTMNHGCRASRWIPTVGMQGHGLEQQHISPGSLEGRCRSLIGAIMCHYCLKKATIYGASGAKFGAHQLIGSMMGACSFPFECAVSGTTNPAAACARGQRKVSFVSLTTSQHHNITTTCSPATRNTLNNIMSPDRTTLLLTFRSPSQS
jgi:hypothetical protein